MSPQDRYRETLQFDVRLINRDLRNHLQTEADVQAQRLTLPDSADRVRFLDQDGSICNAERTAELLKLHKNGWEHLFKPTDR